MADLREYNRRQGVKVGDPYTFLDMSKVPDGVTVGGILSDWWATNEPGRLFRITAIHPHAVETIYLGFAAAPGSFEVMADA